MVYMYAYTCAYYAPDACKPDRTRLRIHIHPYVLVSFNIEIYTDMYRTHPFKKACIWFRVNLTVPLSGRSCVEVHLQLRTSKCMFIYVCICACELRIGARAQALLMDLVFQKGLSINTASFSQVHASCKDKPSTPGRGTRGKVGGSEKSRSRSSTANNTNSPSRNDTVEPNKGDRGRMKKKTRKNRKDPKDSVGMPGSVSNLIGNDCSKFVALMRVLGMAWAAPLQLIASMVFLVRMLGWSALIGILGE